jgi:hypothetical protein
MGNIPYTDIYEAVSSCEDAREIEGIKIIRFEQSIYYANVENFMYKVIKNSGVDPSNVLYKITRLQANHAKLVKKKLREQVWYFNILNFCVSII